jgi:hypothetical protein
MFLWIYLIKNRDCSKVWKQLICKVEITHLKTISTSSQNRATLHPTECPQNYPILSKRRISY